MAEIDGPEGKIFAGNAALHILWGDIAEIRGLAVKEDVKAMGIGKKLVSACEAEPDG
ncbi:MAG: hypothetical protein R2865_17230 [Deinococcales bacterium]